MREWGKIVVKKGKNRKKKKGCEKHNSADIG